MKRQNSIILFLAIAGLFAAHAPKVRADAPDVDTPDQWKPVPYKANAPIGGVTLDDGVFKDAFDNNVVYLMNSFTTNDLLWDFRKRTTKVDPPHDRAPVHFWVTDLLGSNAGRFMMGAGNAVRWSKNPHLRQKLNDVIDGIDACKKPYGYCLAYEPQGFLHSEQANYARAWFTQGLVEAGIAGNSKAYPLLRGQMDWFNKCEYLPKLIHLSLGLQGHIASTRAYFTPVGKPEDIEVAEKYYVQDWWMEGLAAHDPNAVCKYRLNRPHSYEVVGFEAYLDHYRATGEKKYLDAMTGAWDIMHDDFEHVGGTMAICEGGFYPPKSLYVSPARHTGEFCGSVFWAKFNQRFHLLNPDVEKYTAEIEKSIYNIALANQDGNTGIRYHAFLRGRKEGGTHINTCCEGQGTRLLGSLPEYIYSVAEDGLYVDLFEPSTITFKQGDDTITLKQITQFPFDSRVELRLSTAKPMKSNIRVRVPSWASGPMAIEVNGQQVVVGKPGTYEPISREWKDGDTIRFTLPIDFHATQYAGIERMPGHECYFIEYGPVLMALCGPLDKEGRIHLLQRGDELKASLRPLIGHPLNFRIAAAPQFTLRPYFQIPSGQTFDCAAVMDPLTIQGPAKFVLNSAITLQAASSGDEIRYTTDGADPTAASPVYSAPIQLDRTATLKAQIFSAGMAKSTVVSDTFSKIPLYPPSLAYSADNKHVIMSVPFSAPGVAVHYTLDGTEPTDQSTLYTAPIATPASGVTITARAFASGLAPSTADLFIAREDKSLSPWVSPDVFISDLKATTATAGWKTPQMNHDINGLDLTLGGRKFAKGVGTHARSVLVYNLDPKYCAFVSTVGIDNETQARGVTAFEVYLDDKLVYETPPIHGNNELWHMNVPIAPGSKEIKLVATVAGVDYNYAFADWADAGFVTAK